MGYTHETNALARVNGGIKRPTGRPTGSLSMRADIYARALVREMGVDPLAVAVRISVVDVLKAGNVKKLAKTWKCSDYDAVKLWVTINRDVMPYIHQRMPQAVIVSPGAPQGDAITIEIAAAAVPNEGTNGGMESQPTPDIEQDQ